MEKLPTLHVYLLHPLDVRIAAKILQNPDSKFGIQQELAFL